MAGQIDAIITDITDKTPGILEKMRDELPSGFPLKVSSPILKGLKKSVTLLGDPVR
jgi:hypothetical protein